LQGYFKHLMHELLGAAAPPEIRLVSEARV